MSNTPRITKRQAAIIGAYTGIVCGPFGDVMDYAEEVWERKTGKKPHFTSIAFGMQGVADKISEYAKDDFLEICYYGE